MTSFDIVVVGSGSAGSVLAARLSEHARVLVVESGPFERPEHTFDPVLWPTEIGGIADWGYVTPPQPGLNGRTSIEPHGRMVGGSSSLNGMMYQRGDRSDYDAWAHGGAPGWGYDDLVPAFERVEAAMAPEDLGARPVHPAAADFVAAAEALGHRRLEGGFDGPHGMTGTGFFHANVRGGRRFGAREAYLEPALERGGVEVWAASRVTGLLFEGSRCTGVSVLHDGVATAVRAGEVLLAASAAESPKLLMLAGIGPHDALRAHGIPVRVALPGVGRNLHDHVMCVLRFRPARELPEAQFAWEAGVFSKSDPGWVGPDLETIFNPTAFDRQPPDAPPQGITMVTALLRPMSRGEVRLASADPLAPPVLDPRLLAAPADVERLAIAVRRSLELAGTAPLAGWITGLGDVPGLRADLDDGALHAWVRANALSQYHMAGTCRMGLDELAVVDPHLRVHGVEGLRVVDVSVLPRVVSGHCQAAVLAIAERASDLVLAGAPVQDAAGRTPPGPVDRPQSQDDAGPARRAAVSRS